MTLAPHLTEEQLSAHIDSALDAAESAAVAAHLFACQDCGARLEQLRATSRAVSGLPVEEMPRAVDFTFIREPTATAGAETGPRAVPGASVGLA
ncbi:MAG: zf-HC2 domain-containing protein, partial [Candidatus Dormiibacterota bacterium]